MQLEIPIQEKRSDKGFQHISELLPSALDRILDRVEAAKSYPPIPDDVAGQIKWVNENL